MTEDDAARELLASLEDWLEEDGTLGLYLFSWNISHVPLQADEKERVYRQVYDELNRRHDLRLVWMEWPFASSTSEPVEDGTPLDFTLDPDGPHRARLMALIPASG